MSVNLLWTHIVYSPNVLIIWHPKPVDFVLNEGRPHLGTSEFATHKIDKFMSRFLIAFARISLWKHAYAHHSEHFKIFRPQSVAEKNVDSSTFTGKKCYFMYSAQFPNVNTMMCLRRLMLIIMTGVLWKSEDVQNQWPLFTGCFLFDSRAKTLGQIRSYVHVHCVHILKHLLPILFSVFLCVASIGRQFHHKGLKRLRLINGIFLDRSKVKKKCDLKLNNMLIWLQIWGIFLLADAFRSFVLCEMELVFVLILT